MIRSVKKFAQICSETLPISEPVYEFGALQVAGQEGFADLRPFFPGKRYIGTDIQEGPGVDETIDLHDIKLPEESVGTAIMLETIEHVEYPRKSIENIHRVLQPEGILILSTPMNFPIHDYPFDYWRFTPEGIKSLLKIFTFSHVDFIGERDFPRTVVALASKTPIPQEHMENFKTTFANQKIRWKRIEEEIRKGNVKIDHI